MKKKKTSATTTRMAQLETVFPDHIDLDDPHLYINRELGMLEFQRRVLDEAIDTANPLR